LLSSSLVVVCAVGALGCRTADLSGAGAKVAVARQAPADYGFKPDQCKMVAHVIGRGGGALGGAWVSNDKLVEYAMNDVRNQAAAKGANYVQTDAPDLQYSGDKNGVAATSATVSGTAFQCAGAGLAVAAAPAAGESNLPTGVAGFRLDDTAVSSESLCKNGGFTWARDGEVASCTGQPASSGVEGTTTLRLCSDKVCAISIEGKAGADEVVKSFGAMDTALTAKYGRARRSSGALKPECVGHEVACVLDGRAELSRAWVWTTRHSIDVRVVKAGDGVVGLRVSYSTPDSAKSRETGPAL
jgi:hypothetical protein